MPEDPSAPTPATSTTLATAPDPGEGRGVRGGAGRDLGRLARGGALNLFGAAFASVAGFILVVVVTRGMSTGEAGVFFEAVSLFLIVSQTAELGSDTGLTRMIPRYRVLGRTQDVPPALRIALIPTILASCALGVAMYLFAPELSRVFLRGSANHQDALIPYVKVLAVFLPLSTAATVLTSATRGFGTMLPTVLLENLGRQGIRPVVVFAVLSAGLGTTAMAVAYGLPVLLPLIAGGIWLLRLLHGAERQDDIEEGPPRPTRELAGEFWRFTAPRGLAAFFNVTLFRVDTLLLGALLTASAAGIYTAATRLTITGFLALTAVQQVIAPQISELLTVRETLDRAKLVYQTATQWLVLLSWPVYFTLAVFAPLLLKIYSADYTAGATALSILSIATLAIMATGPCSVVLVMGGKSIWALVNSGVALVVDVALNFVLIPKFGMTGAAIAWGAAILVNNLIAVYQVRRFLGLSPVGDGFWLAAGSSTLCFGALGLLVRATIGPTLLGFLLFGVVAGGLYLGFLWLHRDRLHLTILRQALTSRKRRMAERAEWRRAAGSAHRPAPEGFGGTTNGAPNGAADARPATPEPASGSGASDRGSDEDWPLGLEEPELEGLPTWMPLASAAELTGLDEADLRARVDSGRVEGDVWWGPSRQDVLMVRTVDLFRQGLVRASPDPGSEIAPGLPPDTLG